MKELPIDPRQLTLIRLSSTGENIQLLLIEI